MGKISDVWNGEAANAKRPNGRKVLGNPNRETEFHQRNLPTISTDSVAAATLDVTALRRAGPRSSILVNNGTTNPCWQATTPRRKFAKGGMDESCSSWAHEAAARHLVIHSSRLPIADRCATEDSLTTSSFILTPRRVQSVSHAEFEKSTSAAAGSMRNSPRTAQRFSTSNGFNSTAASQQSAAAEAVRDDALQRVSSGRTATIVPRPPRGTAGGGGGTPSQPQHRPSPPPIPALRMSALGSTINSVISSIDNDASSPNRNNGNPIIRMAQSARSPRFETASTRPTRGGGIGPAMESPKYQRLVSQLPSFPNVKSAYAQGRGELDRVYHGQHTFEREMLGVEQVLREMGEFEVTLMKLEKKQKTAATVAA